MTDLVSEGRRKVLRRLSMKKARRSGPPRGCGEKNAGKIPAHKMRHEAEASGARGDIGERKQHDHSNRTDHEHVTHVMPGDGRASLSGIFHDVIVFDVRHSQNSSAAAHAPSVTTRPAHGCSPSGTGTITRLR